MANRRTNLEINEVSLCKRGANQGAKIVLAKSETDSMTELEKQMADITAERDLLKAELEKMSKPEPKVELEKLAPELRALIEKAQSDANAAREEAKLTKESLEKAEKAALEKAVTDRMTICKTVIAGDEERVEILKAAMGMTPEQRDVMFKALEKAETVAAKGAEILCKEKGEVKPAGGTSAKDEIQKKAEALVVEKGVSIQKARATVRDLNPELAKREQAEIAEVK